MRLGLVGSGGIAVLVGGVVVAFAITWAPPARPDPALAPAVVLANVVAQADREIAGARARIYEHARALAARTLVRGVIVTDAASATDALAGTELAQPDERVELGQVVGPERRILVRWPEDAAAPTTRDGRPARAAEAIDATIWLTEVVEVLPLAMRDPDGRSSEPVENGHPVRGYVMVGRGVDVARIAQQLAGPVAGRLELGAYAHAFGDTFDGARTISQPLATVPDARIVLGVPPPTAASPHSPLLLAGGATAAGLGVLLVGVGLVGGRRRRPSRTAVPSAAARSLPLALEETVAAPVAIARPAPARPGPLASVGTPAPLRAPTPASPAVAIAPVRPGTMIGRWQLVHPIGSGGMADVYLARAGGEGGFEKQVAIKVMHPHLARDAHSVAHFLDEGRLAAGITHQNVVAILDLGKLGDDYYIVMEYIDGLDLEKLLASARAANRAVPLHVGLGILRRICDGLHAAHQATSRDGRPLGIIHRDVKSANVLVSRQGAVKVVDFGIAKATEQLHRTIVGETKGTPSVMAPEQRAGGVVDVRADVYAVGVVGYELLTGVEVNIDFMALAHLGAANWPHLDRATSVRPSLPPELDDVLFQAMAFQSEDRQADCAELEAQLEHVMKVNGLAASDKDIARWVRSELQLLVRAPRPARPAVSRTK